MAEDGYYYLHTNGDLIFKRCMPEADSPFVKAVWHIDATDRGNAWKILLESLALGANTPRVKVLAYKWGCDREDIVQYMRRQHSPSNREKAGLRLFIAEIIDIDPDEFFDWIEATPIGKQPDWETCPSRTA